MQSDNAINNPPPPPYPGLQHDASADLSASIDYDLTPMPQAQNRPRLPEEKRNPYLQSLPDDATLVKFQTIVREDHEIVVGRIKVPTPGNKNNHAFILRRYDTNAISLTTMYKVAFPGASEEDERREMEWVRSSYDTRGTNGGRGCDAVRLAGQWVSRQLAIYLAPAYHITELVKALARAVPDPNVAYRKSQRSQAVADALARQREAETNPVPSFSVTTVSPVPKRQRRLSLASPAGDDQRHLTLETTTTLTAPNNAVLDVEAEIQSAKQLVQDIKRELRLRAAAGEDLEDHGAAVGESSRGVKRGNGDDAIVLSGGTSTKERVIKKNKRIEQGGAGETAKKVAWGALLFGLGVGASYLPSFLF